MIIVWCKMVSLYTKGDEKAGNGLRKKSKHENNWIEKSY